MTLAMTATDGRLASTVPLVPGHRYRGLATQSNRVAARLAVELHFDRVRELGWSDQGLRFEGTYSGEAKSSEQLGPEGIIELVEVAARRDSSAGGLAMLLVVGLAVAALASHDR